MASRVEMVGPLGWGILCLRGKGSIHDQAGYLVWDRVSGVTL